MKWVKIGSEELEYLKGKKLCFDTESDGLLPSRFWCASFINILDASKGYYLEPDNINLLPKIILGADVTIAHNAIGYDIPHIERIFKVKVDRARVRDTLVMSRLADSTRSGHKKPHSIEAWAQRFGLSKQEHEDWSQYSPEMLTRNQSDTYLGWLVLKAVLKELRGFSKESIDGEHDLATILYQMKEDGFYLDQRRALELYLECKSLADKFEKQLKVVFPPIAILERVVEPKITKSGALSKAQVKCLGDQAEDCGGDFSLIEFQEFNPNSSTQRIDRLTRLGWSTTLKTKAGNPKFDAEDVEENWNEAWPQEIKLLGKYLMLRQRQKLVYGNPVKGKELTGWLDLVDSNSYLHPTTVHIGAWSHRMSHSKPQTGNIPGVKLNDNDEIIYGLEGGYGFECRDCFRADPRVEGQVLVGADLTAIQLRGFSHYTGDKNYISLVSDPSIKIHAVHGEYLGGIKKDKAKTFIYAFLLGAAPSKLGQIIGGSPKDGKDAMNLFMEKVPGVRFLKDEVIPKWERQGWMTGLDGRRVPVMSSHLALTAALQSFEKCIITHTVIEVNKVKSMIPHTIRAIVHDEAQYTILEKFAVDLGEKFKDTVKKVGIKFKSLCPLTAAYKVGYAWSNSH